ncbi:MAG: response regulator [Schwartzia sp.]|nr:response regulator [Schwartzia sp. (in: firmicutes)]
MEMNPQPCVLIVDDMRVNRTILSSLLASSGIASDLATSGRECLDLCKENDYDLILLDHRMPDMDGVDTLVRLKELFKEKGNDIPVICHTTEDARDNINLYKAAGFVEVLIKPIQTQQLMDMLAKYLPKGSVQTSEKAKSDRSILDKELKELPDWTRHLPGIDLAVGVENCDTAEDYLDALAVFASSIRGKSDEIERLWKEEDYETYTLKVHSLKSMARLIGANLLSSLAADLEYAGKHGDVEMIKEKTPTLLSKYRVYAKYLSRLLDDDADGENRA